MDYIQELSKQLSALIIGEKVKIDVHFIISEPLNSFCVGVNQKLQKGCHMGLINMGAKSIVLPHISIFMGYVNTPVMLEELFSAVYEYAEKQTSFWLQPTKMYFKGISKTAPQYLFIDSLQSDFLMEQKDTLDRLLQDVVLPIEWDMKSERPHVTVGCYKKVTERTQEIVDESYMIPACKISQIGVSVSGKRGVCLGLLKVFELKENDSHVLSAQDRPQGR